MDMIEHEGWWWRPDDPDYRLPGKLTIIPGESSDLSLLGGWGEADTPFSRNAYIEKYGIIPVIYGIETEGHKITIHNCIFHKGHRLKSNAKSDGWPAFNKSGLSYQSYKCQDVLTGSHIDETSLFRSINIRFNKNDVWLSQNLMLPGDPEIDDDNTLPITRFNAEISGDIHIKLISSINYRATTLRAEQKKVDRFYIKSKQGTPLKTMLGIVHHLQNFLILLTKGEHIKVVDLSYVLMSDEEDIGFRKYNQIYLSDIKYEKDSAEDDEISRIIYPLITLMDEDDHTELIPNILRNFINQGSQAGLAYELYFAIAKGEIPSQQQQFLSYMQAIEGLYARKYDKVAHYIDKEAYESGIRKQLYAIIDNMGLFKELTGLEDDSLAQDFAKDLKSKLRHAHTYGFKKRIKEIIEKYPEEFKFAFWGEKIQRERFIKNAVDIRDYLSHGNGDINTYQGFENLKQYTAQLKLLVELCLLEMMDVQQENIISMIEGSNRPLYYKDI